MKQALPVSQLAKFVCFTFLKLKDVAHLAAGKVCLLYLELKDAAQLAAGKVRLFQDDVAKSHPKVTPFARTLRCVRHGPYSMAYTLST